MISLKFPNTKVPLSTGIPLIEMNLIPICSELTRLNVSNTLTFMSARPLCATWDPNNWGVITLGVCFINTTYTRMSSPLLGGISLIGANHIWVTPNHTHHTPQDHTHYPAPRDSVIIISLLPRLNRRR